MSQNINQIKNIINKQSKIKSSYTNINKLAKTKYVYLFDWLGVPTIQFLMI